jgi:excinuclease UvrABC nuclease subunit
MSQMNYFGKEYLEYDCEMNKPYFQHERSYNSSWVYVLLKKGTPIYVGKTIYPRSRIMSHRLNKSFDNVYLFRFNNKDKYYSDADKKASRLERNLIRNFDPEMNVQYRKTKTRHLS